jgi:predicted PurR-regulated permease PerM
VFVGVVLIVYFLVLDFLPQTFVQPYITGRELDTVMMMFGYLLGPIIFGWYGIFLLPILFILLLEAIRIVLPDLVHGEALTQRVELGDSVGTDPRAARDDVTREGESGGSDEEES